MIASTKRVNAVFIRKSTQGQEEGGQIANVQAMLRDIRVNVPEQNWIVGTVSRRKVKENAEFSRLMEMVEADRIGTIYIESQDRWGTADRPELFTLLGILRQHDTCLYDLRAKRDLTERDLATEMLAFVNSIKSEKELQDISYRSLRTRVNNFKDTASWPTGAHPFGYGKACYGPDGALLWVWQPISRALGQIHYPAAKGKLQPGPVNVAIPRKAKQDKIILVPNPAYVKAVAVVFDLYTRAGLSRRQISARLNKEGHRFYSRPFSHSFVTQILTNPAYAGDIHFGKTQTGELHTFDNGGLVVEVKRAKGPRRRAEEERIIKVDCHEALVDRDTWRLAQEKLTSERGRTSFAPRNPAYYLKQLLVCGGCGKGLTGRTEVDKRTGKRKVGYVCPTYVAGRCGGHEVECGYHFISHENAERLLMDKIAELNLQYDDATSHHARVNLQNRLKKLGHESEESIKEWQSWLQEGVDALAGYMVETYDPDYPALKRLRKLAAEHFLEGEIEASDFKGLPLTLAKFKRAVTDAEESAVGEAKRKLDDLNAKHGKYTLAWAEASDMAKAVLKEKMEALETQIIEWKPRAVPLTKRMETLYAAEAERKGEREKLLAEWPALEAREKGEALRRLFVTVTLHWGRVFHPASENPARPRKTDRAGRNTYPLLLDKTEWAFATTDLAGSW